MNVFYAVAVTELNKKFTSFTDFQASSIFSHEAV